MGKWNIFSNHGHVLLFLARHPDARLRDVAANVGITERAVQKIVRDMQDSGVVEVTRIGRRNHYAIDGEPPLQHRLEAHRHIGQVVELIAGPGAPGLIDSMVLDPLPPLPLADSVLSSSGELPAAAKDSDRAAEPTAASDDSVEATGEQRSLF